ncbi:MAG: hypothetical protein AAFQ51_17445 [Pseudomonadota bacterium]
MRSPQDPSGPPEEALSPERILAFFKRIWTEGQRLGDGDPVPVDRVRIHRTEIPPLTHDQQLFLNVMTGCEATTPDEIRAKLELWRLVTVGSLKTESLDAMDQLVLSVIADLDRVLAAEI